MNWFEHNGFIMLIACIIIVIGQIAMAWKKGWTANAVRIVGITIIAFIGVFAALTVDNKESTPAVFGLLGTIAGYLIGKSGDSHNVNE